MRAFLVLVCALLLAGCGSGGGSTPTTPTLPGVSGLGVVHRSDSGQDQLTYQGRPLYTFRLDDGKGDITGDNLSDTFDGTFFTWHAARIADTTTQAPGFAY